MQRLIVGFQVEFHRAPCTQGEVHCPVHQAGMRRARRLPAHHHASFGQQAPGGQSMGHLHCGITTKEAYAKGANIGHLSQGLGGETAGLQAEWNASLVTLYLSAFLQTGQSFPKVPVLTEKTVEGATAIKHGQVMLTSASPARAYRHGHTVGG